MKKLAATLLAVAVVALAAFWLVTQPRPAFSHEDWAAYEQGGDPARGRLVFYAGGCSSCHAVPGQSDPLKLGGGRELKTAFGSFFVPNISPEPQDGIGSWKVVDLANAMLTGVSANGVHDFPAFPYTSFQHTELADIRDLLAFLRTLPPVAGKVRPHQLRFPFGIRRMVGLWKLLYLHGSPFEPDPSHSPEWNRGRYLVEGLGHCAECHSPRNALGAIVEERRFAGGPDPEHPEGTAPNITPDRTGIEDWSKKDLVELLTSGLTPQYDSVGGSMAEVVKNTAELPQADREAMAEYIKSLPPRPAWTKRNAE